MKPLSSACCALLVLLAGAATAQDAMHAPPDRSTRGDAPALESGNGGPGAGKPGDTDTTSGATGPGTASGAAGVGSDCAPMEGERPNAARERSPDTDCGPARSSGAPRPLPDAPPQPAPRTGP